MLRRAPPGCPQDVFCLANVRSWPRLCQNSKSAARAKAFPHSALLTSEQLTSGFPLLPQSVFARRCTDPPQRIRCQFSHSLDPERTFNKPSLALCRPGNHGGCIHRGRLSASGIGACNRDRMPAVAEWELWRLLGETRLIARRSILAAEKGPDNAHETECSKLPEHRKVRR